MLASRKIVRPARWVARRGVVGWSLWVLLGVLAFQGAGAAPGAWEDGTPRLTELFRSVPKPPVAPSAPALAAPPRFAIGHQRTFFAFDFRTNRQYTVSATLRAVGDFCYVYVEDAQWNRRVTAGTVSRLVHAFERETPADPSRGVFPLEVSAFGNPPDVDGDPRIVLLLLDIRDNFTPPSGTFVGGFFATVNQLQGTVRDPRYGVRFQSNETEMLYLDVNPLDPVSASGLGILAHELQHLIHYGHDPNETVWLNEAASEFAMWLCGYPPEVHLESFENDPNVSLTVWPGGVGSSLPHYGAAYLWMLYLYEQYGGLNLIRTIVSHPDQGLSSLRAALRLHGVQEGLEAIFSDWWVALVADDPSFSGGRYGFQNETVRVRSDRFWRYPVSLQVDYLEPWSGGAYRFSAGGEPAPLQLQVRADAGQGSELSVRMVSLRNGRITALSALGVPEGRDGYTAAVSDFGAGVTEVVLLVQHTPANEDAPSARYAFSARRGTPVTLSLFASPNPLLPDYWEVVAWAQEPLTTGPLLLEVESSGKAWRVPMRSLDGGRTFTAALRALEESLPYRVLHFGTPVASGMLHR